MSACPICRKPAVVDYRPFCSKRCADVDLQRWLAGVYAVPAEEEDEGGPPSDSAEDS
jgi:endogenous inhibitor of DNA gyrase (YacG/DUF329 family)